MNQLHDGLGLAQVDPPVQKGAQGELARLGGAGSAGKHGIEGQLHGEGASVQLQFRHVLPGIAGGGAHEDGHALVNGLAAVNDTAQVQPVAFKGGNGPARNEDAG